VNYTPADKMISSNGDLGAVQAFGGNSSFITALFFGTTGADNIVGSPGFDQIFGKTGNDNISAGDGNDGILPGRQRLQGPDPLRNG